MNMKTNEKTIDQLNKQGFTCILIENGDVFIGTYAELYECFALFSSDLEHYCDENDYSYNIFSPEDKLKREIKNKSVNSFFAASNCDINYCYIIDELFMGNSTDVKYFIKNNDVNFMNGESDYKDFMNWCDDRSLFYSIHRRRSHS